MKQNKLKCKENCKTCFLSKHKNKEPICLMCNEGFFLYKKNNECLGKCPWDTIELDNNNLCLEINKENETKCKVANCSECKQITNTYGENKYFCNKCIHGLFLFNNKCFEKCPKGTIANRLNFSCNKNIKGKIINY